MAQIDSLASLKAEKAKVEAEIGLSGKRLEELITDIPGRMLGSTMGMVAGAVAKGIQNHWQNKEDERETAATMASETEPEPESFGQTLQAVGEETAYFALAKLVEKLIARK